MSYMYYESCTSTCPICTMDRALAHVLYVLWIMHACILEGLAKKDMDCPWHKEPEALRLRGPGAALGN